MGAGSRAPPDVVPAERLWAVNERDGNSQLAHASQPDRADYGLRTGSDQDAEVRVRYAGQGLPA